MHVEFNRLHLIAALVASSFCTATHAETLNFNPDWKFIKADPKGAEAVAFTDANWTAVSAPHSFNDVDTFDDRSPSGHRGEIDQWGGRTWYRKSFDLPDAWKGKRVYIEFEAVRQIAEVYLNGTLVGRSQNGFIPFGIDLTDHLVQGKPQVLAVMCDNSFAIDRVDVNLGGAKGNDVDYDTLAHNEGAGKAFPWNNPHWHPAHGGIYRNVFLHIKNPAHFTLPLYRGLGTVGSYSYATDISRESASVHLDAELQNSGKEPQTLTVKTQWLDQRGQVLASAESQALHVAPGAKVIVPLSSTIKKPQLWEPGHPYIYQVHSQLFSADTLLDEETNPLGIRTVSFTRFAGTFINDRHVKLRGWGQKSTDEWPGLGAAQPDWMHYFTLKLMTEAGANFVRWGHTSGGPAQIRSCDQLGVAVLQPGVDGEGDVEGAAWDERLASFRDTVIYSRNNPSIIVWEGGNQSVSDEHATQLNEVVKTYDPHGGRGYGHRRANAAMVPFCSLTVSTEGTGFRTELPTIEGEYDREESPRRVWDDYSPPDFDYKNQVGTYDLTSEQFAVNEVFEYDKIVPLFHGGGANWIFSDSTSGGRVQSEVARAGGEVDGVRLPKEAYYACKVIFTEAPDLHLVGHWSYPPDTTKDLFVVSDCTEVELILNGRSLGRKSRYEGKIAQAKFLHPDLFVFPKVKFEPGTIQAVGYVNGKECARQTVESAGDPVALKLTPITGPAGFRATGSDILLVDVEAVDAKGRRCPTWQHRVDFKLEGPGIWRGGYNSGKTHSTNNTWLDLECGINRVAIRSAREAGKITLTATSEGIPNATLDSTVIAAPGGNGILDQMPPLPVPELLGDSPLPTDRDRELMAMKGENEGGAAKNDLVSDISYSGKGATKIAKAKPKTPLFSDHKIAIEKLPAILENAEMIQLPNKEWNYSAVDLMQFEVLRGGTVFIAQDARLVPMPWLKNGFKPCAETLDIGDSHWKLWKRRVKAHDSVLLGSNTEVTGDKRWQMVVFVQGN